jgi:hypothetical protein
MLDANPPAKLIGNFMSSLNIKHEFAVVDTPHSPVDPKEALRFFNTKQASKIEGTIAMRQT